MESKGTKPVVGYWNTRCLCESIRLLLEYCKVDYEDKRYQVGKAPTYDKTCWLSEKFKLGLIFPNLPYYIDGEIRITETWAILKHIARQHSLVPTKDEDIILCEMIQGVLSDFHYDFINMCYAPPDEHKSMKTVFIEKITPRLKLLENFMKDRTLLAGTFITYLDFYFFEALDQHRMAFPNIFDLYQNISNFIKRIEQLDSISSYRKSARFKQNPVHNVYASWSGTENQ